MKKYVVNRLMITMILSCTLILAAWAGGHYGNYYVKASATGAGDGSSWTNAFTDLQAAIDLALPGDVICVATGTYLPTHRHAGDSLRHSTFYIHKDITIYGGFAGTPGTEGTLEGRDPIVNPTILSGDLGVAGDTLDNAFHVVFMDHVSDTMRLDGFIIKDGNNFGGSGFETYGAGIFMSADSGRCNPIVANCRITMNHADQGGGGVAVFGQFGGTALPTFWNCHFEFNEAGGGGGLQAYADSDGTISPEMINCWFRGNTARSAQGSAVSVIVHSSHSSPVMINSIVTGNYALTSAAFDIFLTGTGLATPEIINSVFIGNNNGSIRVSSIGSVTSNLKVRNSILWNNGFGHGLSTNNADADVTHSIMEFGFFGDGNLSTDPMFIDPPASNGVPHNQGDVHIQPGSPAIDAGNNGSVPGFITTDADGLPRIIDTATGEAGGTVDMGAFEVQEAVSAATVIHKIMDWNVYPNPASTEINVLLPQVDHAGTISLWTSAGMEVKRLQVLPALKECRLNIADLVPGTYYLSITSNRIMDVRKVILQ